MNWLVLAFLGALFTSLTTILLKIGIKNVNSNFATLYRTFIVLLSSIILCLISGSIKDIFNLNINNYIFLLLSGIMTGLSWLCYYKAIKLGSVSKVAPIDKSSFILTSILFLIFFFNDTTKNGNPIIIIMLIISIVLMFVGTIFMIDTNINNTNNIDINNNKTWLIYAILSSVFASLVSFFIKIGLKDVSSDLGTLIRCIVVLIFSFFIVLFRKDYVGVKNISFKSFLFLTLSGIMTGLAWLSEYSALNTINVNPVAVNSISKLSILLTMLFSIVVLKEKFSKKMILGLIILTLGIVCIIVFSL